MYIINKGKVKEVLVKYANRPIDSIIDEVSDELSDALLTHKGNWSTDDIGDFAIKDGHIYQLVGYCPHPTYIFEDLKTSRQERVPSITVDESGFIKLIEVTQ